MLDERHPDDDTLRQPVRLSAASPAVGPAPWRVELVYDPPAGDANTRVLLTRKQEDVSVELVDQPLGVLYVEGYPRWEFRYLKNMLVREKSIKSSVFLLSADRNFAQEGQIPITRLPTTPEELKPYDVIIIGDVPASYFSGDQLKLIADHVATGGAGLLWIGGERDTPRGYEGTPLGSLLPMRSPGMVSRIDPSIGPVQMTPTPLAEAIQVLRLRSPDAPVDSAEPAWPANLAPLLWAQNLGDLEDSRRGPRPSPLSALRGAAAAGWPMIVRMRYGAGDVLYVGTDETWRWRYGRGDVYFERLWMQLVRLLGRARLQQGNGRAVLDVSSHRLEAEQAAVVSLHINDELLSQRDLSKITVAVSRADGPADKAAVLEKIELAPRAEIFRRRQAGDRKAGRPDYQAIWRPSVPGRLTLRVVEPELEDLNATRGVEVVSADDETRHPVPDHEKLAELAEQTGGKVLALDKLDDLATLVPNRARRTPNDIREPLWNSYLALIVVVTLLTAEWIGRKVIRLVCSTTMIEMFVRPRRGRASGPRNEPMQAIAQQLDAVRRTARRLLLAQAALRWVTIMVLVMLVCGLADFTLRLPGWLRLIIAVGLVALAAVWLVRDIADAWGFRPSLESLALRVERLYPRLTGALASGVEFTSHPEAYAESPRTSALMRAAVEDLARNLEGVRVQRLIDPRRTLHLLATAAALTVLVFGGVTLIAPARCGSRRTGGCSRLGSAEWPRRTSVESLMHEEVWPSDTPLRLRARVGKGYHADMRAWAIYRRVGGRRPEAWQWVLMNDQTASAPGGAGADANRGRFERLIELPAQRSADAGPIEFYFQAGDDESPPQRVTLVDRPAIKKVWIDVKPPAYAQGLAAAQRLSLDEQAGPVGAAAALVGSEITLRFELNKPLADHPTIRDWSRVLPGLASVPGARFAEAYPCQHVQLPTRTPSRLGSVCDRPCKRLFT